MTDDTNKEILLELKKMNERLEKMEKSKGLSTPKAFIALFLGFSIIGPIATGILSILFNLFNIGGD